MITDFRAPQRIRLGMAALTTSFADVAEALIQLRAVASAAGAAK